MKKTTSTEFQWWKWHRTPMDTGYSPCTLHTSANSLRSLSVVSIIIKTFFFSSASSSLFTKAHRSHTTTTTTTTAATVSTDGDRALLRSRAYTCVNILKFMLFEMLNGIMAASVCVRRAFAIYFQESKKTYLRPFEDVRCWFFSCLFSCHVWVCVCVVVLYVSRFVSYHPILCANQRSSRHEKTNIIYVMK